METKEEDIPRRARDLYRRTWEGYIKSLRWAPDLTLSNYCKEAHVYCRGVRRWMKQEGLSVRSCKRGPHSRSGEVENLVPTPVHGPMFVQVIPKDAITTPSLHGVSITFPDGVVLTLQDCTPESVVTLVETYERRRSAREAGCSH